MKFRTILTRIVSGMILIAALFTYSCEKPKLPQIPVLTLEQESAELPREAGTGRIVCRIDKPVDKASIEAESNSSWVRVKDISGEVVTYSYEENTLTVKREAVITVSYATADSKRFSLSQAAAAPKPEEPVIKVQSPESELGSKAGIGTIGFSIENPADEGKLSVVSNADWLKIDTVTDVQINYIYESNGASNPRSCVLTLTYPGAKEVKLTLTQMAPSEITLDPVSVQLGNDNGRTSFSFSIKNPVEGEKVSLSQEGDWFSTILRTSSVDITYLKNMDEQERMGKVTVNYINAEPVVFTLTQEGQGKPEPVKPVIQLSKSSERASFNAGKINFGYTIDNPVAGAVLKAETNGNWVSANVTADKVECTYQANEITSERSASLTLSYADADPVTCTITQEAAPVIPVIIPEIDAMTVTCFSGRETWNFSVENGDRNEVTVVSDASWLNASRLDDGNIVFYHSENNGSSSRIGHLTLQLGRAEQKTLTVTQRPYGETIAVVENLKASFGSEAQTGLSFNIRIDNYQGIRDYRTSCSQSWISNISYTESAQKRGYFTVSFDLSKNTGLAERTGKITFLSLGVNVSANIVQNGAAAPVIVLEKTGTTVPAEGGIGLSLAYSIQNPQPDFILVATSDVSWVNNAYNYYTHVSFNVERNTEVKERVGHITLSYGSAEPVVFEIRQEAAPQPMLEFTQNVYKLSYYGDEIQLQYSYDNLPSAFKSIHHYLGASWLSSYTRNTEPDVIYVFSEANSSGADRQTTVSLRLECVDGTVLETSATIIQSGTEPELKLSPSSFNLSSSAQYININVTTEKSWSGEPFRFEGLPSWIEDRTTTTSDLGQIKLYVQKNNEGNARSGTFYVTYYHHKKAAVTIRQAGNSAIPTNVVDLGLSSGIYWAISNLGASVPSAAGSFYAWGETSSKTSFSWSNYLYWNGSTVTKYADRYEVLQSSDDAATSSLGTGWRMPTEEDFEELERNCNVSIATVDGVRGVKYTSKKDSSKYIFFPFTGINDGGIQNAATVNLWTSENVHGSEQEKRLARQYCHEDSSDAGYIAYTERYVGMPIRAVYVAR